MGERVGAEAKCLESFAGVEQGVERLAEAFQAAQAESGRLRSELQRLSEQFERLRGELSLRNAQIAQLEQDVAQRDRRLAARPPAADPPAGAVLARSSEELRRLQETLAQTEEVLRFKDRHIEQLGAALAAREPDAAAAGPPDWPDRAEALQAEINARDMDIARMQKALEASQERIHQLFEERQEIKTRVKKILKTL